MVLGGYTSSEDILYTTIEIAASILALHLASQYELRCWLAVSSLKRALGQPLKSGEATRKPLREKLSDGFVKASLWTGQWSNIGYSNNPESGYVLQVINLSYYLIVACVVVYKGLVSVLPLPRAASITTNGLSTRLLGCIYPPNRLRFFLALVIPTSVLYSTYHGFRAVHPFMIMGWVMGVLQLLQPSKMVMKKRILWLNGLMIGSLLLYGFEPRISSYLSFVFRGHHPERQPQWALRLWLSLCPVVPAILTGMLIGPALRFDLSRAGELIESLEYYPDIGVPIPRTVQTFPSHLYRMAMVGFISARFLKQFGHPEGHSRQITDLEFALPAVIAVSLVMVIHAWSAGYLREWWDYQEDWTVSSPATLADEGEKEEPKRDDTLEPVARL